MTQIAVPGPLPLTWAVQQPAITTASSTLYLRIENAGSHDPGFLGAWSQLSPLHGKQLSLTAGSAQSSGSKADWLMIPRGATQKLGLVQAVSGPLAGQTIGAG